MENPLHLYDGTRLSGFVTAEENQPPRQCSNCIFYKHDHCEHPVVMIDCEVPGEHGKPKPVEDDDCCNGFQSPGKTLLYGLRHGTTEANEEGLHRGWAEIPLDDKGRNEAEEACEFLADKGIMAIYCSDLERAVETATIIGDALGLEPVGDFRLRPINKGDFQGEKKDDTKEAFDHYVKHPDEQIPGGESINEFNERYEQALDQYLCEGETSGPILIVTHNSNCIGAIHYLNDDQGKEADNEIVQPGGVFKISKKKDKMRFEVVFKEGDEDSVSGS